MVFRLQENLFASQKIESSQFYPCLSGQNPAGSNHHSPGREKLSMSPTNRKWGEKLKIFETK